MVAQVLCNLGSQLHTGALRPTDPMQGKKAALAGVAAFAGLSTANEAPHRMHAVAMAVDNSEKPEGKPDRERDPGPKYKTH